MTSSITAIYLVEEDEALREAIVYMLASEWADTRDVRAFAGSTKLLTFVQGRAIAGALVIYDVLAPWDGGLVLYDELSHRIPELKFLFITGYSLSAGEIALLEREGFGHLEKPFLLSSLRVAIKTLLA